MSDNNSLINLQWLFEQDGIYVVSAYIIVALVLVGLSTVPSMKKRALVKRLAQQQRIEEAVRRKSAKQ